MSFLLALWEWFILAYPKNAMTMRILSLFLIGFIFSTVLHAQTNKQELDFSGFNTEYLDLGDSGSAIITTKGNPTVSLEVNTISVLIMDKAGKVTLNKQDLKIDDRNYKGIMLTADISSGTIYLVSYYKNNSKHYIEYQAEDIVVTKMDLRGSMTQKKFPAWKGCPLMIYANSKGLKIIGTEKEYAYECIDDKDDCMMTMSSFSATDLSMSQNTPELEPGPTGDHIYWKLLRNEESGAYFYRVHTIDVSGHTLSIQLRKIDDQGKKLSEQEFSITTKQGYPMACIRPDLFPYAPYVLNDCGTNSPYYGEGLESNVQGGFYRTLLLRKPDSYCYMVSDPTNDCFWAYGQLSPKEKINLTSNTGTVGMFIAKISNDGKVEFTNEYPEMNDIGGDNSMKEALRGMKFRFTADESSIHILASSTNSDTHSFVMEKKTGATMQHTKLKDDHTPASSYYVADKNSLLEDKTIHDEENRGTESEYFCKGGKQFYLVHQWKKGKMLIFSK